MLSDPVNIAVGAVAAVAKRRASPALLSTASTKPRRTETMIDRLLSDAEFRWLSIGAIISVFR